MIKYILRRLVYIVVVFFVVSILVFSMYQLVPGDPALMMVEGNKAEMRPEEYEKLLADVRAKLGTDKPLPVQYVRWIGGMLVGDFGYSIQYKQPVSQMIQAPMKNTLKLNLVALLPTFAITIPLGILSAVRKGSKLDTGIQAVTIIGYSLPMFVVALIGIFIFAVTFKVFPISGTQTAGTMATGWALFKDQARHIALPVIVLVFTSLGGLTRYVRAAMIDALRMDCIRTARAKGLREKVVIYVHAFRNALIPFVTVVTGWFIGIFSGSVVLERTFIYNGMGNALIQGLNQQDFSVCLALMMFYLILGLVGNLVMDLLYGVVDPRVKLA